MSAISLSQTHSVTTDWPDCKGPRSEASASRLEECYVHSLGLTWMHASRPLHGSRFDLALHIRSVIRVRLSFVARVNTFARRERATIVGAPLRLAAPRFARV
jgi:hypothetical protein